MPSPMKVCFLTLFYLIQLIHVSMKNLVLILNVYFQRIFILTHCLLIFTTSFIRIKLILQVVYPQEFLQFLFHNLQHLITFVLIYFPLQEVCHQKSIPLIFLFLPYLFFFPLPLHLLFFLLDPIVFTINFILHCLYLYHPIHLLEGCLQEFIKFILFCYQVQIKVFIRGFLPRVDYLQEFTQFNCLLFLLLV